MLKRFMTWLLQQWQRVFTTLTGRRTNARTSATTTQLGDEVAQRLRRSSDLDADAPVAVRLRNVAPEDLPTRSTSTAPLRQKSSSILKDTVDPAATEPDTHQRLDAAPASMPGGTPASPSFPTEVSELISAQAAQPALQPPLQPEAFDQLPVPDLEPAGDEELPDIHDVLPAVEPEQLEQNEAATTADLDLQAPTPLATTGAESSEAIHPALDETPVTGSPVVESAQRIDTSSDEATLFSFDIIEADDQAEPETSGPVSRPPVVPAESAPENVATTETGDVDLRQPEADTQALSTAQTDSEVDTSSAIQSDQPINPWLMATPNKESQPPDELLSKTGTVKLLFKLKPGNFHGYIAPDDGTKDILFHQKYINADIFEQLERGAQVVARVKHLEGKVYATRVDLLQE